MRRPSLIDTLKSANFLNRRGLFSLKNRSARWFLFLLAQSRSTWLKPDPLAPFSALRPIIPTRARTFAEWRWRMRRTRAYFADHGSRSTWCAPPQCVRIAACGSVLSLPQFAFLMCVQSTAHRTADGRHKLSARPCLLPVWVRIRSALSLRSDCRFLHRRAGAHCRCGGLLVGIGHGVLLSMDQIMFRFA